jgi:hypothetical protein
MKGAKYADWCEKAWSCVRDTSLSQADIDARWRCLKRKVKAEWLSVPLDAYMRAECNGIQGRLGQKETRDYSVLKL